MTTWFAIQDALTPAELTVRAQAISPNDEGNLLWDTFYTRQDVASVELNDLTSLDYRPTADRREWNARGRRIPAITPARRKVSIVPIEANDKIEEYEIQRLVESMGGNADLIRQQIGVTVPQRTDRLAEAVWRRVEVDAMQAWSLGTLTQRDPEDASKTYVASFGFSATRYTTAPTAWNDVGVNAFDLLLAWIAAAEDLVGPIEGVMLRLATMNAILADAPNMLVNNQSLRITRSQLADAISQQTGRGFDFFVNEQSHDIFTDGGIAYTRTKVWPAEIIAAIPQGQKIGSMAFAPVARAAELAAQVGPNEVNVRGVSVFYESANSGRELNIEAQLNAVPVPDEQKLYVTDVGV